MTVPYFPAQTWSQRQGGQLAKQTDVLDATLGNRFRGTPNATPQPAGQPVQGTPTSPAAMPQPPSSAPTPGTPPGSTPMQGAPPLTVQNPFLPQTAAVQGTPPAAPPAAPPASTPASTPASAPASQPANTQASWQASAPPSHSQETWTGGAFGTGTPVDVWGNGLARRYDTGQGAEWEYNPAMLWESGLVDPSLRDKVDYHLAGRVFGDMLRAGGDPNSAEFWSGLNGTLQQLADNPDAGAAWMEAHQGWYNDPDLMFSMDDATGLAPDWRAKIDEGNRRAEATNRDRNTSTTSQTDSLGNLVESGLQNPSRYDNDLIQQLWQRGAEDIDTQYDDADRALEARLRRQGIYDSTFGGTEARRLAGDRRSAMSDMTLSLADRIAQTMSGDRSQAIADALGLRGFNEGTRQFDLNYELAKRFGLDDRTFRNQQFDWQKGLDVDDREFRNSQSYDQLLEYLMSLGL